VEKLVKSEANINATTVVRLLIALVEWYMGEPSIHIMPNFLAWVGKYSRIYG